MNKNPFVFGIGLCLLLILSCAKEDTTETLTSVNALTTIPDPPGIEIAEENIYTVYGKTHKSADKEKFRIAIQDNKAYFFDDKVNNDWILLSSDKASGLGGILHTYIENGNYDFESFLPQNKTNNFLTLKNRTTGYIRIVKFVVDNGEILKTPSNNNREVPFKRVFFSNPAAKPYQFPSDMFKFENGFILGIPEVGQNHLGEVYILKNMNQNSPKLLDTGLFDGTLSGIERIAFNDLGTGDFVGVVTYYENDGLIYSKQIGLSGASGFYGDGGPSIPVGTLNAMDDLVFLEGRFIAETSTIDYCTSSNMDLSWNDCEGCLENCENIIYIEEANLENIYHHQEVYDQPTTIVYLNVTHLPGFVYFHQNVNIKEVRIPNLQTIGENLYMHQNENFERILIPKLESIGETIYSNGNESLTGLSFPLLTSINANGESTSSISGNTSLTEFNISALTELGGSFSFSGNSLVETLSFPLLTGGITGFLNINGNDNLTTVNLPGLNTIGNDDPDRTYQLYLSGNPNLVTLDLTQLTAVYGYLFINGNTRLTALNLPNLVNVGGSSTEQDYIRIRENASLLEVQIPELASEIENLHVSNNAVLQVVSIPKLPSITGHLFFDNNANLEQIDVSSLVSTGEYVYITRNTSLTNANLSSLSSVGIPGTENAYLYMTGNTALTTFQVNALTEIYGYLYIIGNSSLDMSTTLCNLSNVYAIDNGHDCRDATATIGGNANDTVCYNANFELCGN